MAFQTIPHLDIHEVTIDKDRFDVDKFRDQGYIIPNKIQRSVKKRQAEFLAGRYAANKALVKNGFVPANGSLALLSIGKNRNPIWPNGYTGSITHTKDIAKAVVANTQHYQALGLDCEQWLESNALADIEKFILLDSERAYFEDLVREQTLGLEYSQLVTLAFSAKESVFKSLYPFVQEFFGFECAEILDISPQQTIHIKITQNLCKEFAAGSHLNAYFESTATDITTLLPILK